MPLKKLPKKLFLSLTAAGFWSSGAPAPLSRAAASSFGLKEKAPARSTSAAAADKSLPLNLGNLVMPEKRNFIKQLRQKPFGLLLFVDIIIPFCDGGGKSG